MHKYSDDFYGEDLKLLLVGYLRPEMSFDSLQQLIDRIHTDKGLAAAQLAKLDPHEAAGAGWWRAVDSS
jgi:FAD synthase